MVPWGPASLEHNENTAGSRERRGGKCQLVWISSFVQFRSSLNSRGRRLSSFSACLRCFIYPQQWLQTNQLLLYSNGNTPFFNISNRTTGHLHFSSDLLTEQQSSNRSACLWSRRDPAPPGERDCHLQYPAITGRDTSISPVTNLTRWFPTRRLESSVTIPITIDLSNSGHRFSSGWKPEAELSKEIQRHGF